MSDTMASLSRKIQSAGDLQSVVRTMKTLAVSNISQYEQSVRALADYDRTVKLGLGACLQAGGPAQPEVAPVKRATPGVIGAVVFGSDQGLVGRFNETVADYAVQTLAALPGTPHVWAVGERVRGHLSDAGIEVQGLLAVPQSVKAITPLVGRIQLESESQASQGDDAPFYVFHNRPQAGALYEPVSQRLLPLDAKWRQDLAQESWPTKIPPEVMRLGSASLGTLRALIREYLFMTLFRACAESLASENASRLAAMERAEKNIRELLETLHKDFHHLRQSGIDAELFDVVAGFSSTADAKQKTAQ